MIPTDKLEAVQTIVVHAQCADGTAAAIILRDAFRRDVTIRFVRHGAELASVEPEPGMLFCDIAPPRERAPAFVEAGAIVLDHHRSVRDIVALFGELGVYADEQQEPGVSGAVLAYRDVWRPLATARDGNEPGFAERRDLALRFAELAGIRDTWQVASPYWRTACEQAEALRFWPWTRWPEKAFSVNRDVFEDMILIGPVLLERREERVRQAIKDGDRFTSAHGTRTLIVSTTETSDVAEAMRDDVDLVVGFAFRAEGGAQKMILSTRSRGTFDCATWMAALGGGGHTRAAGAELSLQAGEFQPYTTVRMLLAEHERELRRLADLEGRS